MLALTFRHAIVLLMQMDHFVSHRHNQVDRVPNNPRRNRYLMSVRRFLIPATDVRVADDIEPHVRTIWQVPAGERQSRA